MQKEKKKMKRNLFQELAGGVREMELSRTGKVTLRQIHVEVHALPRISPREIKKIREELNLSQSVFAQLLRVNPRTLANWEQGRSEPNDQAIALILMVKKYPDTLTRLQKIVA